MKLSDRNIHELVNRIPKGKVATYGQIAQLLGYPNHARQIGFALSNLSSDTEIPWHRVVNAKGELSHRSSGCESFQRIFLEEEGITFNEKNRISLKDFQWQADPD